METTGNTDLLLRLSCADAVAAHEDEVRAILAEELAGCCDDSAHDGLGSALYLSRGSEERPVSLMFAAHMDEVGFLVRHISDIGMAHLMPLGGVLDKSKEMQLVRVTTAAGAKVPGILNVKRDGTGAVADAYVDLGVDTAQAARDLGVEIGDTVTFASEARPMAAPGIVAGKALDDRAGCYVIAEALRRLHGTAHAADVWMAATSSEEVGTRGGKCACDLVRPDVFFAIDVANHPELDRGFTNHRKLGAGPMLVCYDKTMAPNPRLLALVRETAERLGIAYQLDMLKGGGTDCAQAHLVGAGRPALVIGLPLRYCHGAWSLACMEDLEAAIELVVELARTIDRAAYEGLVSL